MAQRAAAIDTKYLRKARGLTLTEMSEALDRSVGWLSEVERDKSAPTISDLRQIAKVLGVPMSMLFGQSSAPAHEQGYVVRSGARRPMGGSEEGLIEELSFCDGVRRHWWWWRRLCCFGAACAWSA